MTSNIPIGAAFLIDIQNESLNVREAIADGSNAKQFGIVAPLRGVNHSRSTTADATAIDFQEGVGTVQAIVTQEEVLEGDDQSAGVGREAIDLVGAISVDGFVAGKVGTH